MTAKIGIPYRGQSISSLSASLKPTLGAVATSKLGVGASDIPINAFLGALAYRDSLTAKEIGAASADLLDSSGVVKAEFLPSYVDDVLTYPTHNALPTIGETGKIYLVEDTNRQYRYTLAGYVDISSKVESVNDKTGVITISKTDIGLSNVNNTSDADKPISTATQTALDTKVSLSKYLDEVTPVWKFGALAFRDAITYGEISGTPAAQVQSDWAETNTSLPSYIKYKPQLASIATSGNYKDLTNTPNIVEDWKLGALAYRDNLNYSEISGTPTIPAAQIQSNWIETDTASLAYIKNKPVLKAIATSGLYSDLTGVPVVATTSVNGLLAATDKIKLDAISGTNTGDETSLTIKTKLGITALSGSNTGDQDLSGFTENWYLGALAYRDTLSYTELANPLDTSTFLTTSSNIAYSKLPVGTIANTVCAGNDARLVTYTFSSGTTQGAFTVTPSTGTASTVSIYGLGSAAYKNIPNTGDAGTTEVVLGSDSRLSNARTPTSHTLLGHTVSGLTTGTVLTAISATEVGFTTISSGVSEWKLGALAYRDNLNYSEIENTPTIPAAQVNSDWNATSGISAILNKPSFLRADIPIALGGRLSLNDYGFVASTKTDITTRTDSGFWQVVHATTANGWPEDSYNWPNWYHLLSATHTNDANYYALQFAASFFDSNKLFYRSTNGSGTTIWNKIYHSGNSGAGSGLDADLLDGKHASSFLTSISPITYSQITTGTVANTIAKGDHTHGNITTDGKIGSIGGLILATGANGIITTLSSGSNGQVLTSNGTSASWANLPGTSVSINNETASTSAIPVMLGTNSAGTAALYSTSNVTIVPNTGKLTAGALVKSGGTSSQFLKADGTVDSSSYITGITSANVVGAMGLTTTTGFLKYAGSNSWAIDTNTYCVGNDARLSDARTPTSHALTSHTATCTTGQLLVATGTNTFGFGSAATLTIGTSGGVSTYNATGAVSVTTPVFTSIGIATPGGDSVFSATGYGTVQFDGNLHVVNSVKSNLGRYYFGGTLTDSNNTLIAGTYGLWVDGNNSNRLTYTVGGSTATHNALAYTSDIPNIATSVSTASLTVTGKSTLTGQVEIGTAGYINFSQAGSVIKGNFAPTLDSSRAYFQSTGTSSNTYIAAAPAGTGSVSAFVALNSSGVDNSGRLRVGISASSSFIESNISGTGTVLPLTLSVGAASSALGAGNNEIEIGTDGVTTFSVAPKVYNRTGFLKADGTIDTSTYSPQAGSTSLITGGNFKATALESTSSLKLTTGANFSVTLTPDAGISDYSITLPIASGTKTLAFTDTAIAYTQVSGITGTSSNTLALGNHNHTDNNYNLFIGNSALAAISSGGDNVAIGTGALYKTTTGSTNTAIGAYSLANNTTGYANTAIGIYALNSNVSGGVNLAIGSSSLSRSINTRYNVAIGSNSLLNNNYGNYNIALGANSLMSCKRDVVGITAFASYSSGTQTLITTATTHNLTTGQLVEIFDSINYNGIYAINILTTTQFIITKSYITESITQSNVPKVFQSIYKTASGNIAIGFQCAYDATTGSDNIFIGNDLQIANLTPDGTTISGNILIGNSAALYLRYNSSAGKWMSYKRFTTEGCNIEGVSTNANAATSGFIAISGAASKPTVNPTVTNGTFPLYFDTNASPKRLYIYNHTDSLWYYISVDGTRP